MLPSTRCLCDLHTVPGFFCSPEVLGHQQVVIYQIPPFWLILETSICKHFHFPTQDRKRFALIVSGFCPRGPVGGGGEGLHSAINILRVFSLLFVHGFLGSWVLRRKLSTNCAKILLPSPANVRRYDRLGTASSTTSCCDAYWVRHVVGVYRGVVYFVVHIVA